MDGNYTRLFTCNHTFTGVASVNDFNLDLTGKKVVVKQIGFWKNNASTRERTFLCQSGRGCTTGLSLFREIQGKWVSDGMKGEISSLDIEKILD